MTTDMNEKSRSESYAGCRRGYYCGLSSAVELMKKHVVRTEIPGVLSADIGGFGGLFEMDIDRILPRPVLVSAVPTALERS